jgi:outer membrane protein OmpA-like peptidoglycan-associated protein
MKMKKVILSCLMLMGALSVSAQEQKGTTEYVFEPHWYVQIQPLGLQYTTGEVDFGDLLSYNVQAALGRQFSPVIGARLALNAWQGKAGYDLEKNNLDPNTWKYTYFSPTIDLTFNLSNLIAGFNPNRKVNFGAFIGGGVAFRSAANDDAENIKTKVDHLANVMGATKQFTPMPEDFMKSATLLVGQAGLTADFKVSEAVSLGLEFNANITGDKMNHKDAGNPDSYFNLLAGAKINLGPTYSTRFIPAPEPEIRYVEKIVEKIVEVPAPAPVVEPLRRDIFFLINKTDIRESEAYKIQDIVDYLNAHATAKVAITGYADAGTGNDRINDRLAAGRADAVVKALKAKGISESRISFDSKGSREQPFPDNNDANRVSVCIAE